MMTHPPSQVIRQLLLDLSLAAEVEYEDNVYIGDAWPVTYSKELDSPDDHITVYDTDGVNQARLMINGLWAAKEGIQFQVRSKKYEDGWLKASDIVDYMNRRDKTYANIVEVESSSYRLHAMHQRSRILRLGNHNDSKREHFTINYLATIEEI